MAPALYGRATAPVNATGSHPAPGSGYPLHTNAILLPVLAFPAWFLCIPPLIWHFSQRNIAAWSQIAWFILINFFNFINPLIWPRDNFTEWYDGKGLCDIEVRILIGAGVALPACTAMIMRKLAKVLDTSNITMIPSRNRVRYEKTLEIFWCWGYPAIMSVLYYVVQPRRYWIFAISGCIAPAKFTWLSVGLVALWPCVTVLVASFYAGLLVYRLIRYRREFINMLSAQNTTKSRFMRLFAMSTIVIVITLPYTFWLTSLFVKNVIGRPRFSWSAVHSRLWSQPLKFPTRGVVQIDKWGQIAAGYVAFLVFGTGRDAYNTYKRMLCFIGLGKVFPSLYEESRGSPTTTSSFRTWCSQRGSKAWCLITKGTTATDTVHTQSSCTEHSAPTIVSTSASTVCPTGSTHELVESSQPTHTRSFLARFFTRRNNDHAHLPLHNQRKSQTTNGGESSPTDTIPSGVHARAWASSSESPAVSRFREDGVCITQELRQQDSLTEKSKF